ncbi:protein-histidine kinase [Gigaspora margarita]|uniref:Protein-histidine kinase n=1 Tax=Gigaspora margarita TaxID=4874 RepID=A0A8H3XAQ1_GIGMA|nr:protein-histidine kinase [Gigaspora margarita]
MTNNSGSNNENSNLLERFYNYDWSSTSLGPIDSWEPQIKSILDLCFKTGFPTYIHMGPDWISIYNEASIPVLQSKHPHAIEIWADELPNLITDLNSIRESGKGICGHDLYIEAFRDDYKEEMYSDFSLNPIYKLDGTVWGVMSITTDSTQKVLNKRRLKTLNKLSCQTADAESLEHACHIIMKALQNNQDIPYALIYLVEKNKNSKADFNSLVARLVATTFDEVCKEEFIHEKLKRHIPDFFPNTHEIIDLTKISDQDYNSYIEVKYSTSTYSFLRCDCWPINLVIKEEKPIQVLLKDNSQAILLPIKLTFCNNRNLSAVLICGINILRKLDDEYMEFYKSVLNYVNRILIRGMSIEEEKRRAKMLADLNHQKDMFFQGISHELKTPLTLIFSPLDELIKKCSQDTQIKSYLQIIQRSNAIKHTWNGSICVRLYLDHKNEQKMIVLEVSDTGVVGEEYSIKGFEKGANNYLKKPFSSQELISHIQNNIKLSKIYHKILYQQHRQEKIKQLLLTISEIISSENDLIEALSNIIKVICSILTCDRIFIVSCGQFTLNTLNNTLVALYENLENIIPIDKLFQDEEIINLHSQSNLSQTLLNNSSGIEISLNTYCTDTCKNVSMLSVGIRINDGYWGWIKLHRPSNSIWLNSEIELLQQISNQISLAVFYKTLIEENLKKEIQVKAETIANKTKTQILANTSHELRTPLGAIIGLISCFNYSTLTDDQKDMINIIQYTSDFVISIINEILNAAKLEVHQIISINTTFNLLDLFEKVIKQFIKDAENKQIELILNYDIENLPRYIKSNPERLKQVLFYLLLNLIKFTETGKIIVHVSKISQNVIDNKKNSQIVKKDCLLIELQYNSNRHQYSLGLDLLICKNLVTINGGAFIAESQLEKESKFGFTWNIDSSY